MTTDLENTIEYYKDLLLYQYINQPKARATIGLLCSQAIVELLPVDLNDAFDLETAEGSQLDILGEYIGLSRRVVVPAFKVYFTFNDQENETNFTYGFTDYTNLEINSSYFFYNYKNVTEGEAALSDDDYKTLLQLKSFLNNYSATYLEITNILYSIFQSKIILYDNYDMGITYFISNEVSNILIIDIAYLADLLPKPMGVLIRGIYTVTDPLNVWSWGDYEMPFLKTSGFSDYITGNSSAEFLDYSMRI